MPPRTTFALADRQKDSCLHPSRPKRNIIQKEKAGNAPSLAHEKGHRQTDRQTHRQTTTTLIASGPPLRGDPYFVCISTTLLRNNNLLVFEILIFFLFTAHTSYRCVEQCVSSEFQSATRIVVEKNLLRVCSIRILRPTTGVRSGHVKPFLHRSMPGLV